MRARRLVPGAVTVATVAALGVFGLTAAPAMATGARGPAAGQGQPQWLRSNTGATHSPRLLRELAHRAGTSATVINGPAAAITAGPVTGAQQGTDVASYQHPSGAPINWAEVAQAGIKFVAVKATEGDYYTNPYALSDLQQAQAAGLSTVAYAFAIPNGGSNGSVHYSASPVTQADDLLNFLGAGARTIPLMLDIEYDPYAGSDGTPSGSWCYGLSKSAMVSWVSGFDAEIRAKTGRLPIIYTPADWWSTCTGGSTSFGQTPAWTPYYSGTASSPALPAGWANWNIWQYGQGTVSGISGSTTDLDELNPGLVTLLNPGARQSTAGPSIYPVSVTPFTVSPPPSLTFTATGLPPGLTIGSTSGQITGWLGSKAGTYNVTVTAADSAGTAGSAAFTWTVKAAPTAGPTGPVRLAVGGKCLNDVGNSSKNGTAQDIWTCNGSTAQRWTVVMDGTLRIHGKCLEVANGGTASGTPVVLYSCNGSGAQQWQVRTKGQLANPQSGMCLTDPGGSRKNGTRLRIAACAGKGYQEWQLPGGPVRSLVPGKCLNDVGNGSSNGTAQDIWTCNGSAAQKWVAHHDETIRIHRKCLDLYRGSKASGTRVALYSCDGSSTQRWWVNPAGSGEILVNAAARLCLTDPGGSNVNGTRILIATCDGSTGQNWRIQ